MPAPHVPKFSHRFSASRYIRALERARVEGHALVPRVHRVCRRRVLVAVVLGVGSHTGVAVVDRVLELADDVHPHVHVRRTLLGRLPARLDAQFHEVVRAVHAALEGHALASERRRHPLVGVVEVAVVVVELLVVLVRAAGAALVHLALRARREALDRACMMKGVRGGLGEHGTGWRLTPTIAAAGRVRAAAAVLLR
eukprot:scaffold52750_cov55-Phaeocystis_antarctica.AAC.1